MERLLQEICLNCGSIKFKSWEELTDDEKFVVKRISDESDKQKEKQSFCKRCFYALNDKSAVDV